MPPRRTTRAPVARAKKRRARAPGAAARRVAEVLGHAPSMLVTVDTRRQRMRVFDSGSQVAEYPVSTSRFGVGNADGSNMTPPGVHRIAAKIGAGAPPGRIFRSRADTGEQWDGVSTAENLILTRILRLEGLEDGINRGPGIDSFERYIYIHGTNREDCVGVRPISHGCVCMRNRDVIELFDRAKEETIVVIN